MQSRCLVFMFSTKREIRHFHVVRAVKAKKCTKKRNARAKLLICHSKPSCVFAVLVDVAVVVA